MFDVATGGEITLPGALAHLRGQVAFSPDGKCAAVGQSDVRVWDVAHGKLLSVVAAPVHVEQEERKGPSTAQEVPAEVRAIALAPGCRTAAIAYDRERALKVKDIARGGELTLLRDRAVNAIAMPAPGVLIVASPNRPTVVLDAATGHTRLELPDLRADTIAISPGAETLATAHFGQIRLWELGTGKEIAARPGHAGPLVGVAITPDGATIATASAESVRFYRKGGPEQGAIQVPDRLVHAMAVSPDGALAAFAAGEVIRVVRVPSGEVVRELLGISDHASLAFSPDGNILVAAHGYGVAGWDLRTGRAIPHDHQRGSCASAAFVPGGARVLALCGNALVILDGRTLAPAGEIAVGPCYGHVSAFSQDGRAAAISGQGGVEIWSLAEGRRERVLAIGASPWALAFAPSGRTLAAALDGGRILVADLTGPRRMTLEGHSAAVTAIAWASEDELVSGSADTTALVWRPPP
jgi:WD40 repeat protein